MPSTTSSTRHIPALAPDVLQHLKVIFNDFNLDGDVEGRNDNGLHPTQREEWSAFRNGLGQEAEKGFHAFLSYATSPAFNAFHPSLAHPDDLSYPLSCYFISSSHNTYLTGNQLFGRSSTLGYKNVLYTL